MDRIFAFTQTVTTAGTPVALSATSLKVASAIVQAKMANTKRIAVAGAEVLFSTNTGGIIGAPASATATPPSITISGSQGRTIDLSTVYIDAELNGEGVMVLLGER